MEIHPNMFFRYVVGPIPNWPPDVLVHVCADVCLQPFVMPYRVLQPANPRKNLIIAVHRLPFAADLRLLSSSSRDDINPHAFTFSIA